MGVYQEQWSLSGPEWELSGSDGACWRLRNVKVMLMAPSLPISSRESYFRVELWRNSEIQLFWNVDFFVEIGPALSIIIQTSKNWTSKTESNERTCSSAISSRELMEKVLITSVVLIMISSEKWPSLLVCPPKFLCLGDFNTRAALLQCLLWW